MNDSSVTAAFLSGIEAGRFQGYEDGRQAGYRDGWRTGYDTGHRRGWDHHEDIDRIAFDNWMSEHGGTLGQPSYAARRAAAEARERAAMKPLKTPAECLASWSTP